MEKSYYFILFFILGVLSSLVINKLILNFSESLGIRNKNDVMIRWSNSSRPSLGGIAIFISFLSAIIAYLIFTPTLNLFSQKEFVCFFVSATLGFLMGLADDAYNTQPILKLLIQIACGLLISYGGTTINVSNFDEVNTFLTVFWVVVLMNSLNMLDNMDGITTTAALFILSTCFIFNLLFQVETNPVWNLILLTCIGSLIGFLCFNFPPAKMFMGDSGSQFIGLICAFFSIKFLWGVQSVSPGIPLWVVVITVMVCFTSPFIDTLSVIINRLRKKTSPFIGGKDHTTHHLVYAGYNERSVFLIFVLIGFISMLLCVFYFIIPQKFVPWSTTLMLIWLVLAFYFLYQKTIKYAQK